MAAAANQADFGHPISVVVRRTGLTQDILRAWEKRYRAVVPLRTATGRRLYTEDQIEKLRLLKRLIDGGRRISDVAALDLPRLRNLAAKDASEAVMVRAPVPWQAGGSLLDACIEAVDRCDRRNLEEALTAAAVALTRSRLRDEVLVPLIQEIGDRWQDGSWRIMHEHVATAVVRAFLWSMWHRAPHGPEAPALVVATLAGQRHELGALLAAGIAADCGWRVVYLGCDLPAEEIALAVQTSQGAAAFLSLVYPPLDPRLMDELRRLRQLIGEKLPLAASGWAACDSSKALAGLGVRVVTDPEDLQQFLESVSI